MWITTNDDGTKLLWDKKPIREGKEWLDGGICAVLGDFPFPEIPSFAQQQKWKDAPIQVKVTRVKK